MKRMRIGILTQSMAANYGCNLQAYALQTVLQRMGMETEILDRWDTPKEKSTKDIITQMLVQNLKDIVKLILGKTVYRPVEQYQQSYFWHNFIQFQKRYLRLSPKLFSSDMLKEYSTRNKFDAFIVGSDQVWRPSYNIGDKLYNMFLDFVEGHDIKKVSYAASFGVDVWEFSDEQTYACRKLASAFDAISVRESSGIELCAKYLNVDAVHVLDPTLLLYKEDYNEIIANSKVSQSSGNMFCYILDSSESLKHTIENLEKRTGYKSFTCLPMMPENTYNPLNKPNSILPSIEQWLKSFIDADLIIADSFHGMVFSIIYNKPFWVVGNPKRGYSRFSSLLKLLDLEDRIVSNDDLNEIDINCTINWDSVNQRIEKLRLKSFDFLENVLKYESSSNKYNI